MDFYKFEARLEFPASQGYLKHKQIDRSYGGGSVNKCLLCKQEEVNLDSSTCVRSRCGSTLL